MSDVNMEMHLQTRLCQKRMFQCRMYRVYMEWFQKWISRIMLKKRGKTQMSVFENAFLKINKHFEISIKYFSII